MTNEDFKDPPRRASSDKNCMIKHSKLLVVQRMMHIDEDWSQWFTLFLMRGLEALEIRIVSFALDQ